MASLRRVAELNNSGASMLVAARDKDAFKTLQTALSIMEQEMLAASEKSGESSSGSERSAGSTSSSNSDTRSSTASTATSASTTTETGDASCNDDSNAARFFIDTKSSTAIPELRDDRYFIFNQALLVVETTRDHDAASPPPSPGASSRNTAETEDPDPPYSQALVCFYTSVVIYNLALAYHKRGMMAVAGSGNNTSSSSSKNASLALSQSLRLYEHCLKIVRSIANYSEDCKMLLYAVSCNLAHLYCRKGDRSRAQELLDGLDEANHFCYQNLI